MRPSKTAWQAMKRSEEPHGSERAGHARARGWPQAPHEQQLCLPARAASKPEGHNAIPTPVQAWRRVAHWKPSRR